MLKLNKTIKQKIVSNAIIHKYKKATEDLIQASSEEVFNLLYERYYNEEIENLPEEIKAMIPTHQDLYVYNWITRDFQELYSEFGFSGVRRLSFTKDLRGPKDLLHDLFVNKKDDSVLKIKGILKKIEGHLRKVIAEKEVLTASLSHYKTTKSLFSEMPWAEEFYPVEHKEKKAELIPVSLVAEANEIMGIKA